MNFLELKIKGTYGVLLNDYKKGIVHCGKNGPYDDPETKVRNLCNLIIASCVYNLTENYDEELSDAIDNMATELLSLEDEYSLFVIRNKKNKDACNGVLGHAWVIESLLYLYLNNNKSIYIEKSRKIYFSHKFNSNVGLWSCPEKFGSKIDMTINHQIWFAGVAAELYYITKEKNILNDLQCFEKLFWRNTKIHSNGLISHYVQSWSGSARIKNSVRNIIDSMNTFLGRPSMFYKENGYHMFCLSGLARLKLSGIGDEIYIKKHFVKALQYCNSDKYICGLLTKEHHNDISTLTSKEQIGDINCNLYGYPYNAPGLEVKFVQNAFGIIADETVDRLEQDQLSLTFNEGTNLFEQNAIDIYDLSYKIYERMIGAIN